MIKTCFYTLIRDTDYVIQVMDYVISDTNCVIRDLD